MKSNGIILISAVTAFIVGLVSFAAAQTPKDAAGFTRLRSELGTATPSGTNITVTHVEGTLSGNYMPDTNHIEFAGKGVRNLTGSSTGVSSHANTVGQYFYGRVTGLASNIPSVDVREASEWINTGFLRLGDPFSAPYMETNLVQNHSWIITTSSYSTNILRRLDYAIDRDGFTCAVGLNNGNFNPQPEGLCSAYNIISVGLTDGNHSSGTTPLDTPGRPKPEIVAPESACSWAVPQVASAAALLMDAARARGWTNALRNEAIKAMLMAGATKGEFPSWDRTAVRPIDETYGAGELNVYNSRRILIAGRQAPGTTNQVGAYGWDIGNSSIWTPPTYYFTVSPSNVMANFSAMLVWNRKITDADAGPPFDPVPSLANLDLRLYSSTGFALGPVVDLSTSILCNVEHIYRKRLDPGQYAMEVQADDAVQYALAWRGDVMVQPDISMISRTGSSFIVQSLVSTGFTYLAQISTNLADTNAWTALDTNVAYAASLVVTGNPSAALSPGFYRIVPWQ